MNVETIAPALVRDALQRIESARRQATESSPPSADEVGPEYWEPVFESNAAAVLERFPEVRIPSGFAVRYLYYGKERTDLLVRPLVTRIGLDLGSLRSHLDWHPAPDSTPISDVRPTRDVELLYRHFDFERSAAGFFLYWIVLQEIWASAAWVHSRVIPDREEFERLVRAPGWSVRTEVESHAPCVVRDSSGGCDLVVLRHRSLGANTVDLLSVRADPDGSIRFREPIGVAVGPKGYLQ